MALPVSAQAASSATLVLSMVVFMPAESHPGERLAASPIAEDRIASARSGAHAAFA